MSPNGVWARFDDALADRALVFNAPPQQILVAATPAEVPQLLARVDAATAGGAWAWGLVGYEAGAAFEPAMGAARGGGPQPAAWFAISDAPRHEPAIRPAGRPAPYWTGSWTPDTTESEHRSAVERIRSRIADGDVYQANLTARFHGRVVGDALACYADLVAAQRGAHHAYLDFGRHVVLSASPELFFEWTADGLRCAPMKGTAARGDTPEADERRRDGLRTSAKDVAENVMIVDLLRNDLGRIAVPGTVSVPRLLEVERYETVWQLTSTITAVPRRGTTLTDVFAALFPCGSVTGAPKVAATTLIREVETSPRGVYCGALGWVAPPGQPIRARFNVAIRTLVLDRDDGSAVYGSGGGITTGSEPAAEWQELLTKAAVLGRLAAGPLELLETFGHDGAAFVHLDLHLARLAGTAAAFGFPFDGEGLRAALTAAVADPAACAGRAARVSLRLAADGTPAVRVTPLDASPAPVHVALDAVPVDSSSVWLRHKTSRREVYDAARARYPGLDDVLLRNERGEVTESTVANVAVRLGGRWYTPPVSAGCLPGVGRAVALASGRLTERVISVDELPAAEELALVSSLRGWRRAVLAQPAR